MEERKNNNLRRNDFIDLMMDSVKELEAENNSNSQLFTDEDIEAFVISNALMLFFVGNDTTSGALSLVMLNLALHQDVQEKLYNEIKVRILKKVKLKFFIIFSYLLRTQLMKIMVMSTWISTL